MTTASTTVNFQHSLLDLEPSTEWHVVPLSRSCLNLSFGPQSGTLSRALVWIDLLDHRVALCPALLFEFIFWTTEWHFVPRSCLDLSFGPQSGTLSRALVWIYLLDHRVALCPNVPRSCLDLSFGPQSGTLSRALVWIYLLDRRVALCPVLLFELIFWTT